MDISGAWEQILMGASNVFVYNLTPTLIVPIVIWVLVALNLNDLVGFFPAKEQVQSA